MAKIKKDKTFTSEVIQEYLLDVMNMGMKLRQDQLNGETCGSGKQLLENYMIEKGII